jgi:2,3-bisphosphoglycerate-dependent phosphoglycerate mutase
LEAALGLPVRVLHVGAMAEGSQHPVEASIREVERRFLIGVPGVTEILLIRHGDCYQGMSGDDPDDPPLSALGQRQSAALAGRLRTVPLAAVYASHLQRARQTAATLGHPVEIEPRLAEAAITWDEGKLRFTERIEDVAVRVAAAIDDATARHRGSRVVMVSHAAAIMAYLGRLLQLPAPGLRLLPYFTSVSVVRAQDERRIVASIADATHLAPGETPHDPPRGNPGDPDDPDDPRDPGGPEAPAP